MLPPSLHLAAPRALALASPQVVAATAVTLAPTAYRLALQISGSPSKPNTQLAHHRNFHWWCRHPRRRYASWGRHNPVDGTEKRPLQEYKHEDDLELSPREKIWKAKMDMINKMMRHDAYDGLFGPSNRMLKGLNWRDNGWRKMWEEQWRDMEKLHGIMSEEARAQLDRARNILKSVGNDLRYPDSELAKQAIENGKVKQELARAGWEYDAIENKMVPKRSEDKAGASMPGRKEEKRDGFVEIPVKPFTERSADAGESMPGRSEEVRAGFADIPVKQYRPKVEICPREDAELAATVNEAHATASGSPSRRIPVPTTGAKPKVSSSENGARRPNLPKDDMDFLTAEDVRARMGHVKQPVRESGEQRQQKRVELEASFEEAQEQGKVLDAELVSARALREAHEASQRKSVPKAQPEGRDDIAYRVQEADDKGRFIQEQLAEEERAVVERLSQEATEAAAGEVARRMQAADINAAPTTAPGVAEDSQWRLQREQLKEAVADFEMRERKLRKSIRELQQLQQHIASWLSGLQGRSDGLVRSGSISPKHAVNLGATSASLEANTKVLSKASALLAAAINVVPKAPQSQAVGYLEPSLDRYAWGRKPFAKIRDAKVLVQNVRDSLEHAEEAIGTAEARLEKSIKLAGSLNAEVERQRTAMRGYEEKWRWRQDGARVANVTEPDITPSQRDARLVDDIKNIYEDEYGTIDAKHRQTGPTQDLTQEEQLAAMSLGGIPEISPASFDGDPVAEITSKALPVTAPHTCEATYTVLALDPAMGLITKATTSSTAKSDSEEPIPLAEALQKVAQPAMFISYLPELRRQGFEPISSSENMMVLKQLGGRTAASVEAAAEVAQQKATMRTETELEAGPEESKSDSSYYSTRLQSPTSSTFQGLKPKKVEPVFSGEQGGHANYERLRRRLRNVAMRERLGHRRRGSRKRGLKRAARTVVTLAAACYIAGVVSEWLRGESHVASKEEASRATDEA